MNDFELNGVSVDLEGKDLYKKYLIYDDNGYILRNNEMEIKLIENNYYNIICYSDINNAVSFIVIDKTDKTDYKTIINDVESFFKIEEGNLHFKNGFSDFNGNIYALNKKDLNKKHLIYKENGKIARKKRKNQMLESFYFNEYKIIVFTDVNCAVGYIITQEFQINEKDLVNFFSNRIRRKFFCIPFLNRIIFIGKIEKRIRKLNPEIKIGYDKEKTKKIHSIFNLSFSSINSNEILDEYLSTSSINIPLYLSVCFEDKISLIYPFNSSHKDKYNRNNFIFTTKSIKMSKNNEFFVRKSITGQFVIVVTEPLDFMVKVKDKIGYVISKFKKKNTILFFEKFAKGASESSFVLFCKFLENGNNDSFYIMDSNEKNYIDLKSKYGEKIVSKNSLKHFVKLYTSKSFISSDLISHVQRRLYDNSKNMKKLILNNKNKIFLQHGPSLATDVFKRGYFTKKSPLAPNYICVSSEVEKDLFLTKSSYEESEILKVGLANMDEYIYNRNMDKKDITFMLTWRPWDLVGSMEKGSYIDRYLSFVDIIKNDSFYKDKNINVVLHPKAKMILETQFPSLYEEFKAFTSQEDIKDILLRSKVLITDYSSVCFYAFSGNSNLIFYWEDNKNSEEKYGAPIYLNEDNIFGDIVYDFDNLNDKVKSNYFVDQNIKHKNNFDILIETTNGNNASEAYNKILDII